MAEHIVSCPACGHPTRTHNDNGCTMGQSSEACFCIMTPAEINAPALEHVDLAEIELPDVDALWRGGSWLCEACTWTSTAPGSHCDRPLTPVWVTLTRRREVSRG